MPIETLEQAAERIYHAWDSAWAANDIKAFLALYTDDAIIESPLVTHLLGTEQGICRGKSELRKLIEIAIPRKPAARQYYRPKCFTDGKTIMWEYPRQTPNGEQMDFVEVLELREGLIAYHRVYWGWYGVNILKKDAYHA